MVLVTWRRETGVVEQVRPGGGPGDHTDDVPVEAIREALNDVAAVDEATIAAAVMMSYDGPLLQFPCHVTADTYEQETELLTAGDFDFPNDADNLVTTIGFVELDDQEDKLTITDCETCEFAPEMANDWSFTVRENDDWVYHDWSCPNCDSVVHTELVEMPEQTPVAVG